MQAMHISAPQLEMGAEDAFMAMGGPGSRGSSGTLSLRGPVPARHGPGGMCAPQQLGGRGGFPEAFASPGMVRAPLLHCVICLPRSSTV